MKRIASVFLAMLMCNWLVAQTYYVSSTEGLETNDGLSAQTPKKDLHSMPKKNVTILLKRGDVFWGGISGYENCTISAYGQGERPVICGFKVLVNTDAWKDEGNGLWSLDLSNTEVFRGNVEKKSDATFNNIGFIYDAANDKIYGRNLSSPDSLKKTLDFFTTAYYTRDDIKEHPINSVIVRSDRNPSIYGNLCFPAAQFGVDRMTNCKISGIAVVGFSLFGMVHLNGGYVEDCQIDMIGGAIQIGYKVRTRYGNGIELWYQYCDNTITNCLISRTYDSATTLQASGNLKSNPRNNHFVGNRIYKCRQAFEHFMNPSDGSMIAYENCEFSRNICYMMGDNEFESPEPRDCNILSYENKAKPITIKNNVFFGGNHLDGTGIDEGMSGNKVYLFEDQYLYTRHWLKDKRKIVSGANKAVKQYKAVAQDKSKIVVLRRGSKKAKREDRKIRRKVDWKPVDLHLERIAN